MRFLISRTDKIGDVVLTLPLAGWLKKNHPGSEVYFLGRTYTQPVIEMSRNVDGFLNWDLLLKSADPVSILQSHNFQTVFHVFPSKEIALICKKAGIPSRVGTSHRWYHWLTCTQTVNFSRKNSLLHEAQLNFRLLGLREHELPKLPEIPSLYGVQSQYSFPGELAKKLHPEKLNIILHPMSKGRAREWGLSQYKKLTDLAEGRFQFFLSGGPDEAELLKDWARELNGVVNISGTLSLSEFIGFIGASDGLIAASTGPLHIAAALGINALGIYPPIKPMDPSRWAPVGEKATFQVASKACSDCRRSGVCPCMDLIKPEQVLKSLDLWKKR